MQKYFSGVLAKHGSGEDHIALQGGITSGNAVIDPALPVCLTHRPPAAVSFLGGNC